MRSYFREVSYGWVTYKKAAVVGWFVPPDDPNTPVDERTEAFLGAGETGPKRAYLIRSVDPFIDYAVYDRNKDGVVTDDELAVLWVYSDSNPSNARTRPTSPSEVITDDGVRVRASVAVVQEISPLDIYVHELAHVLDSRLKDLYDYPSDDPRRPLYSGPGSYSLMGSHWGIRPAIPHLDPYAKIHLGWVLPTPVSSDVWATLSAVQETRTIYIIVNPARLGGFRLGEYVLIENRYPGLSFEGLREAGPGGVRGGLKDVGLAIWHIDEDGLNFPSTDTAAGPVDINRRRIKLLKCGSAENDWLWAGNDLCFSGSFTFNWNSGQPSNVFLRCISLAGRSMEVYFDVPGSTVAPGVDLRCKPDLRLSGFSMRQGGVAVATPRAGQQVEVRISVENWGRRRTSCGQGSCSEPVVVEMFVGNTKIGSYTIDRTIRMNGPNLPRYEEVAVFYWTPTVHGQRRISFRVDPTNAIRENAEGNNFQKVFVTVCRANQPNCLGPGPD